MLISCSTGDDDNHDDFGPDEGGEMPRGGSGRL